MTVLTESVISQIQEQIESSFNIALIHKKPLITRINIPIEISDILTWLDHQSFETKLYWSERDQCHEVGAIGTSDVIQLTDISEQKDAFQYMRDILKKDKGLRFYGGFSFNETGSESIDWRPLEYGYFFLPLFEIVKKEQKAFFACNIILKKAEDPLEKKKWIIGELQKIKLDTPCFLDDLPKQVIVRRDYPDKEVWVQRVSNILWDIQKNKAKKVVLSRRSNFFFSKAMSPFQILSEIKKSDTKSFHFCLQKNSGWAFIGGSPERLYYRDGNKIETEALAATKPRGKDSEEDALYEWELTENPKETQEHLYVFEYIKNQLQTFCTNIEEDKKKAILKLPLIQHLLHKIRGTIKESIQDEDILKALHPTPAVSGYPINEALFMIRKNELYERGWYAGPFGWIGSDKSQFIVAIRSGTVIDQEVSLYSGAGILKGSDPIKEWQEVEKKIGLFLKLFEK